MDDIVTLFTRLATPFHPEDIEWRAGATNSDKTTTIILSMKTPYTCLSALIGSMRDALKAGWRLAITETMMTVTDIMRISVGFTTP